MSGWEIVTLNHDDWEQVQDRAPRGDWWWHHRLVEGVERAIRGCAICGRYSIVHGAGILDGLRLCDVHHTEVLAACRLREDEPVAHPTTGRIPERPSYGRGTVYYAELPTGLIKIGVTANARTLAARMRTLEARLLATVPGGMKVEQEMHERFEALRVRRDREWFRAEEPLLTHISGLAESVAA